MEPSYLTAASLSELGGSTVRLAFTSSRTPSNRQRMLSVKVAPLAEGQGGEATVFKVEPSGRWSDEDYQALNIPPGTPLVARFSTWSGAGSPRRKEALGKIIELQRTDPDAMIGMVSLYGFGKVDRINATPVHGVMIHFDLMAFAGEKLDQSVGYEPGKRWSLDPMLASASLLPAARALAAVHSVIESLDGHSVATAHRDIKPENMLVVWPESKVYRLTTAGVSASAVPGHGLPLVRIVDLGGVRTVREGATKTMSMPNSERWTPADSYNGSAVIPSAADVWSFGVVLFFAATQGAYPWAQEDPRSPFDQYRFLTNTLEPPDSPQFAELPDGLARLIMRCLSPNPAARPPMYSVAAELEALIEELHVFAETSTPTQQVPLVGVMRPRFQSSEGASVPSSSPRDSVLWMLAAGLVLICLALALVQPWNRGSLADATPTGSASEQPLASDTAPAPTPVSSEAAAPALAETTPPAPLDPLDEVFGIGPWTFRDYKAIMDDPTSRMYETTRWAAAAASSGREWTYARFGLGNVIGAEAVIRRPSFVYVLLSVTNNSTRSMTFDLGNCTATNTHGESGSGPSLVVAAPVASDFQGFAWKTGAGPKVARPACDMAIWPGPFTVPAGQTWTADQDYPLVFEMPEGSDQSRYTAIGLLLKSTEGDVAFQQFAADTPPAELIVPAPGS